MSIAAFGISNSQTLKSKSRESPILYRFRINIIGNLFFFTYVEFC